MEFGLGLSMAQQMVRVMNEAMTTMYVPGSASTIPQPNAQMELPIYVALDGAVAGPFSASEFVTLVKNGAVTKETLSWQPGMTGWQPIEKVPSILKIIALTPPPLP